MKVPQARSRISIAPSMLVEKKGRGYKDVSIGQAPREDTIDYPPHSSGMALPIKISVAQKRTLKKGGAITIKPDMIMKEAEHQLSLLPASAKKIMNAIVKNKGIRHTLKQGEDLVNRMTGKGLFNDFLGAIIPHAKAGLEKLGEPFKKISGVNPATLGYTIGHDVIGPALLGKKKKGKGAFKDFFTKTIPKAVRSIPSAIKGKVNEYKSNPKNIIADVLDAESPLKIPVINKNPEAMLLRGKGGKLVSTRNGCGTAYISNPYKSTIAKKHGGSFVAAGGGLYPSGISGKGMMMMEQSDIKFPSQVGYGIDTPIQLGSPYIKVDSPAMTPFIPTRGIQSSQII